MSSRKCYSRVIVISLIYSVSSIFREDQVFFKWYGRSYAGVLKCFTRFFVQNEESKRLLESIGIKDVDVVGDTRFDRVLQIKQAAKHLPICEAFRNGVAISAEKASASSDASSEKATCQDYKVFVAGSSWPPDEEIFIRFFNEHKDWRLLIAPHVIAEEHLKLILSLLKDKKVVRYTQTTPEEAAKADVLKSCELTGIWEKKLRDIEHKTYDTANHLLFPKRSDQ